MSSKTLMETPNGDRKVGDLKVNISIDWNKWDVIRKTIGKLNTVSFRRCETCKSVVSDYELSETGDCFSCELEWSRLEMDPGLHLVCEHRWKLGEPNRNKDITNVKCIWCGEIAAWHMGNCVV